MSCLRSLARYACVMQLTRTHPRCSLVAALASSASAFHVSTSVPSKQCPVAVFCRNVPRNNVRNILDSPPKLRRAAANTALTMAGTNTLSRTIEEEERRIGLWKVKFSLSNDQVAALRESFQVRVGALALDDKTRKAYFRM